MLETIYLYLNFTGYKIVKLNDIKISHHINEHSRLYLSALLDESAELEPIYSTTQGTQLELSNMNREIPMLFSGMVQTIQIKHLSGVYHLEILAVSNSFQMDVKRERRSFQNKDMKYKDMITEIMSKYEGGDFAYRTPEEALGAFTMQYEETDWEFIKRMASRFNQGLVADVLFHTPKFTFGIPQGNDRGKLEQFNFYIKKDIGKFMVSSQNTNPVIEELDTIEFHIQAEEEFMIGDSVSYQNISSLFIKSVEAQMIQGVLLYNYVLSTKKGLTKDKLYNEKITGLALKGRVLEAIQDTVKVLPEIDDSQDVGVAWQFPYTTSYTAEGNGGWYCMPEKDDTVFIYFPTKEEADGVGVSSIRGAGADLGSPDVKVFRTPNGKELKFSPNEILITCVDDSIFIRLNEESGIEITSSQPISINTQSNLTLDAKKKISLSAKDEISLNCKSSKLKMDTIIDVFGTVVKIN